MKADLKKDKNKLWEQAGMLFFIIGVALCNLLITPTILAEPEDIDMVLQELSIAVGNEVVNEGMKTLGVVEFLNNSGGAEYLGGDTGAVGKYCAEKFEEGLVRVSLKRFSVIERRRLDKVIEETGFQVSDLATPAGIQKLGTKIEGLEGIVLGMLTRTGSTLRINTKVVTVPKAEVKAPKSGKLSLTPDLLALFGESVYVPPPITGKSVTPAEFVGKALSPVETRPNPIVDSLTPYALEVLVDGKQKPLYNKGNDIYIPSSVGEEYVVRLKNKGGDTMAVSLFIDGLNTIEGVRELPLNGPKWVVEPGKEIDIKGWQVGPTVAKKFVFVPSEASLAARKGFADSIGLITAVFYPVTTRGLKTRGIVGTGAGKEISSTIKEVSVQYERTPSAILTLHYDSADIVEKMGRKIK